MHTPHRISDAQKILFGAESKIVARKLSSSAAYKSLRNCGIYSWKEIRGFDFTLLGPFFTSRFSIYFSARKVHFDVYCSQRCCCCCCISFVVSFSFFLFSRLRPPPSFTCYTRPHKTTGPDNINLCSRKKKSFFVTVCV